MFCSTLGAGTPAPSLPNDGGGPAAVTTAVYSTPMLALPLTNTTPPMPALSSGESNIISSAEVSGSLPGVSPVIGGGGVISSGSMHSRVGVVGEAMEEAEEVEEVEEWA